MCTDTHTFKHILIVAQLYYDLQLNENYAQTQGRTDARTHTQTPLPSYRTYLIPHALILPTIHLATTRQRPNFSLAHLQVGPHSVLDAVGFGL